MAKGQIQLKSEIIKILAPLVGNPNAPPDTDGITPIHAAAWEGHLEIIKILAPLTNDPNPPIYQNHSRFQGKRPIDMAEERGNAEIVEFLAQFHVH